MREAVAAKVARHGTDHEASANHEKQCEKDPAEIQPLRRIPVILISFVDVEPALDALRERNSETGQQAEIEAHSLEIWIAAGGRIGCFFLVEGRIQKGVPQRADREHDSR